MKPKKKKEPKDYPIMAFRLSETEKKILSTLIDSAVEVKNEKVKPDETKYKKNDVIVEALKIGLKQITKTSGKKK